jgi:hypothetical protein
MRTVDSRTAQNLQAVYTLSGCRSRRGSRAISSRCSDPTRRETHPEGILTSLVNKSGGSVSSVAIWTASWAAKACIGIGTAEINFNQFETPQTILVEAAVLRNPSLARERAKYLSLCALSDKRNKMTRGLSEWHEAAP